MTRRVVDSYDRDRESELIAESAQMAVATSAALEIGAVGLGTLVTVLASTAAADITGVLMAGVIAALGLFVIPARRRQAKIEMREKITALRERLSSSLRTQFEREIERSLQNITEAIAPYTRFVRAEREKLLKSQKTLEDILQQIEKIRARIEDF
jgi:septal ring factor EnvC (AmiA/AmiB activator)